MNKKLCIRISLFIAVFIICQCSYPPDQHVPYDYIPELSEGDTIIYRNNDSSKSDSMVIVKTGESINDTHDETLFYDYTIRAVYLSNSERTLTVRIYHDREILLKYINIWQSIPDTSKLKTYMIDGMTFESLITFVPKDSVFMDSELDSLVYDLKFGMVKYYYHNGEEYVIDKIVSATELAY